MTKTSKATGPEATTSGRRGKAPAAWAPPKTLGACADMLYTLREERAALQRQADAIEAKEKMIKEKVIAELPKSDQTGAIGSIARVTIVPKSVPQVEDWPAFYAYVAKKKAWPMLQKRLGEAAIRERWDAGEKVPGVTSFDFKTVSVNKV